MKKVRTNRTAASMPRWRQPHVLLTAYGLTVAIVALLTLPAILGNKAGVEGGLSGARAFLGGGILLAAMIFLGAAIKSVKDHDWAERLWEAALRRKPLSDVLSWIAGAGFLMGWIGCFLRAYRVGEALADYLVQSRPVFLWFTVLSGLTLVLLLLERAGAQAASLITSNKAVFRPGLVALAVLIVIAALVGITGIGLRVREDFWYGISAPVLGSQVMISILAGVLVYWMQERQILPRVKGLDLFFCLALWSVTAYLWARQPLDSAYFMPSPEPPNGEFYPYSDSMFFDAGSQFALIGQGILNGGVFDRALYISFLTCLHALLGQDTEKLMTAQAALLAVFPAVIYLLGKELHSRALGVSAGVLAMLRGINFISAATWIDLASPKLMLTDFPTTLGVAVLALLTLRWLKQPSRLGLILWAGGALGLTFMLRTNVIVLLPGIAGVALLALRRCRRLWLAGTLLLVLGMVTATLPWDLRNHSKGVPLFYMYYSRIYSVLIQRYGIPADTFIPTATTAEVDLRAPRARFDLPDFSGQDFTGRDQAVCDSRLCSVPNHLFHNLISSVLFLPTSPVLDDLRYTIKASSPFWKPDWVDNNVRLSDWIFITFNLALVALGMGVVWERHKVVSLLPIVVFLFYMLSNALALTSGGRYVAPADWVVCLYYILGWLQLAIWGVRLYGLVPTSDTLPPESQTSLPSGFSMSFLRQAMIPLVVIFALGALVPLAELPFPQRYQSVASDETLDILNQEGWLDRAGLDLKALTDFLANPQAKLLAGRALYPRYYKMGHGEPGLEYPFSTLDFPRVVFLVIGPFGEEGVIVPAKLPTFFPHTSDVVALGCEQEQYGRKYIDALVVFVLAEPGAVYVRDPGSALQCPLQQPYCENNELCWPK